MSLPVELRLQIFEELWAHQFGKDQVGSEHLAASRCILHYFQRRRKRYLSTLDSLGLSRIHEEYPSFGREALGHPICVLPASPSCIIHNYVEEWQQTYLDFQRFHLVSRASLLGSESFAERKPQDFQGHKTATSFFESWEGGSTIRLLVNGLKKLRINSLQEATIIFYPVLGTPRQDEWSRHWNDPFTTLGNQREGFTFLASIADAIFGLPNGGHHFKKINIEVWGLQDGRRNARCFRLSRDGTLERYKAWLKFPIDIPTHKDRNEFPQRSLGASIHPASLVISSELGFFLKGQLLVQILSWSIRWLRSPSFIPGIDWKAFSFFLFGVYQPLVLLRALRVVKPYELYWTAVEEASNMVLKSAAYVRRLLPRLW